MPLALAVFSLAPIPLAAHLVFTFSDRVEVRAFQYDRDRSVWSWPSDADEHEDVQIETGGRPGEVVTAPCEVSLMLSISARVSEAHARAGAPEAAHHIEIYVPSPNKMWLTSTARLHAAATNPSISRGFLIVMMEPSENGKADDSARIDAWLARLWERNTLTHPLMRASAVVISRAVLVQHSTKMVLVKNDDVIESLTADASKKSLAHRVHQGRLHRRADHLSFYSLRDSVELAARLTVSIPNDELGALAERCGIAELLGRPSSQRARA